MALAAAYSIALWRMPDWMHQRDPKDRHNARLLVVSAGGAVVVAVSLLYTARSYRLSHRGQVTDRFTKALERLSSTDIDARLGGIPALAHVAADSRPHHDDVVEVLEAFVRRRASKARRDNGPSLAWRPRLPQRPDSDVQAALTALGRRPCRPERRTRTGKPGRRAAGCSKSRRQTAWRARTAAERAGREAAEICDRVAGDAYNAVQAAGGALAAAVLEMCERGGDVPVDVALRTGPRWERDVAEAARSLAAAALRVAEH